LLTSIAHEGEFKNSLELAELVASLLCKVSNGLTPLKFADKVPVEVVPDEFIITSHQVEAELEKVCLHKATSSGEIPNWVLKVCAPILANPVCSIFNASIKQGTIPALWKCADVIPIAKVPKPKLTQTYGPSR